MHGTDMRANAATIILALTLGAAPASPDAVTPTKSSPAQKEPKIKHGDAAEEFFARGPIPRLRVELTPESLQKLRDDGRAYVEATVRETAVGSQGPEMVYPVGVHLKGGAGSLRGIDDRPGLTLNFGKYAPAVRFHGLRKIHLNNSVQDPSYMSEDLGNTIFRDAGIPATRVTYARVWINERDMGVYVLKEGFADAFLKRFFEDPGGTVYEGAYSDIDGNVTPRVNKAAAKPERIKTLIEACRQSDPSARREKLGRILDIDRFLTLMAVETMTAHWDGYCPNVNNYRVYDDPKPHRLVFLPHGTDQLFQQSGFPLIANRGIVARALTDTLEDRATYLERVAEVRKKVFTPELLGRRLDEVAARLAPAMADVGADALRRHKEQTDDLRRRIEERIRNIDQQLASTPKPLKFNSSGVAVLTDPHWQQRTEGGNATLDVADEATHPRLHIRATGDCVASFRTTATLPKGSYVFEGSCKTAGVVAADGQNSGAGLRISGGRRDARLVGDNDWQPVRFEFDVDGARDVVLVCELRATAGEAWFDAGAFKLRRR